MQTFLNKKICVRDFLEAAQYSVVVVQNVKVFTTAYLNDSSFQSNNLLFAHIPSSGCPEQILFCLILFCMEIKDQDVHYI